MAMHTAIHGEGEGFKVGENQWLIAGRCPGHSMAQSSQYCIVFTVLYSAHCTVQCTVQLTILSSLLYCQAYCTVQLTVLSTLHCTLHEVDCMTVDGGALLIGVLGDLGGIFTSWALLSSHTANYTLHTTHNTMHTAHCSNCTIYTTFFTLNSVNN